MVTVSKQNITMPKSKASALPRVLKHYETSDFDLQQRVRFIYYLITTAIAVLILTIFSTGYIQLSGSPNGLYLPILFIESFIVIIFCFTLFLLARGFYNYASHFIISASFACVWIVMWIDKADVVTRLDTVVYILAILSMTPLLIQRFKSIIILYLLLNFLCLLVFTYIFKDPLQLSNASAFDFILDTSIALFFAGITGYNIFRINKMSIERAISDIKERKVAESALEKSENKLRGITDLLPQTVFETDLTGNLTYINKSGLVSFGYVEDDFQKGVNVLSMVIQEDRKYASDNIRRLIDGDDISGNQYTAVKKDGTAFPIQIYSSVIFDNQKPVGLRGIIIDITERKNAEKEIKQRKEQFESLVSNIPGITYRCLYDQAWTMLFISSEVDKISGYPSSDFIQNSVRTFESVIHPDDREYCSKAVETAIQLAKPWEVEYKVLHCDGGIRWAYEKGRAITNSEGAVEYLDGFILDITERKRIDELLRESELRYKTLVETSQDGISLMDLNGVMLFVNKRKAEMVRASNEKDLIGTSAFNLLSENSRIAMGALMPQLVLQGYMDNIEADVLRCDGTIFNAEFNVKILKDSSGIPRYMMDTMRDITERKKAENALKESEFKFKSLFETSSDAIFIMDKSMYLDCNSKTSQIFGCDNYHIIGHSPLDFSPEFQPDGKSSKLKAAEKINAALNGEPQYFEWLHKKFDGTEFNAEISLNRVIIKGEYLLHAIVRDISERKRAEMALKESEELFKSIIELAPNAIVLNDSEGRYLLVNNAFAKNSGYAAEEVIGKTNKDLGLGLSPESDEIIRKELISTGSIDNLETSFQSKNGKRIDLYYSSKVIQFNNQPVILSSTIDITEKKITEKELESYRNHLEFLVTKRTEELAAANEELSATNEELFYKHKELHDALENLKNAQKQLIQSEKMASLGVLAAGVAHEINNPLNFISGGIHGIDNYIKDNLSEHTENVSPLIEAVNIGVTRAADIVKSLNRFSRQTESASEKCDLNTIINNCIVILNNQIKDRIEIRKNITNSKYILIGNEGKLHQVVLNIVTNAIQAIEKKGVITLSTIKKDQMIVLMVQDSGHGIEKEILNRIFDPFFTTKEAGKGTGLGLAICYQIIKELNGTIEVQSEVGKGTNITISLPVD